MEIILCMDISTLQMLKILEHLISLLLPSFLSVSKDTEIITITLENLS